MNNKTITYTLDFLSDATKFDQETRAKMIDLVEQFVEERNGQITMSTERQFRLRHGDTTISITEEENTFTVNGIR